MSMNQPITFPASKLGGTAYVQSIGGASPTSYLFYDKNKVYTIPGIPASGPDGVGKLTSVEIDGVLYPVSAAVEIQSSEGAHLLPRLTTAERTATTGGSTGLGFIPFNGMQVYDTDLQAQMSYINSAWANMNPIVLKTRVTLSSAQIEAMYANPVLVIPAVAGKIIVIDDFICLFDRGTANLANGGNYALQYGNTAGGGGPDASAATTAAGMISWNVDTALFTTRNSSSFAWSQSEVIGVGIFSTNLTGAFTANGGTFTLDITYRLVDSV